MILHAGIDGGLHDVVGTSFFATLAYVALSANAIGYYARRWWNGRKGGK